MRHSRDVKYAGAISRPSWDGNLSWPSANNPANGPPLSTFFFWFFVLCFGFIFFFLSLLFSVWVFRFYFLSAFSFSFSLCFSYFFFVFLYWLSSGILVFLIFSFSILKYILTYSNTRWTFFFLYSCNNSSKHVN